MINNTWYSPDGSQITIEYYNPQCSILDLTSGECYDLFSWQNLQKSYGVVYHPTSFIVAAVFLGKDNIYHLTYYNTKTNRHVATMLLPFPPERPYESSLVDPTDQCIDFSYDGKTLLAVLGKKHLVLEIPFEALYQPDTKEKCIFALWVLKNYKDKNGNNILPQELAQLLTYNLLRACKYSFTNY